NDGTNPPSNAATATISVVPTNDAPTLNLALPNLTTTMPYHENDGPLALVTSGSVTDPDAPANFNGGSFKAQITNNASSGDEIVLLASSGFTSSGNGVGSSISFGGQTIGIIHTGTALGSSIVQIDLNSAATP